MQIRSESTQRARQLERDRDFAHAYRMQPCRCLPRQAGAHIGPVNSQALPKFFAITTTPEHLQQIARQKAQKPERPKQIVDDADHCWIADCELRIAERNSTSVA